MTTWKRWSMLLAFTLVANVVLAAGPGAGGAYACTCAGLSSTTEEWFQRSDAVFSGEVVEIGKLQSEAVEPTKLTTPHLDPVTFDVKVAWKGVSGESVIVHGQGPSLSCGLDFERGETYLIFAGYVGEGEDRTLHTDYCGHTFPASEETARNILGPPPEVLPDTGGIAPRPVPEGAASTYAAPTVIVALGVGLVLFRRALRER